MKNKMMIVLFVMFFISEACFSGVEVKEYIKKEMSGSFQKAIQKKFPSMKVEVDDNAYVPINKDFVERLKDSVILAQAGDANFDLVLLNIDWSMYRTQQEDFISKEDYIFDDTYIYTIQNEYVILGNRDTISLDSIKSLCESRAEIYSNDYCGIIGEIPYVFVKPTVTETKVSYFNGNYKVYIVSFVFLQKSEHLPKKKR